jgi:hypothetical protein
MQDKRSSLRRRYRISHMDGCYAAVHDVQQLGWRREARCIAHDEGVCRDGSSINRHHHIAPLFSLLPRYRPVGRKVRSIDRPGPGGELSTAASSDPGHGEPSAASRTSSPRTVTSLTLGWLCPPHSHPGRQVIS